jgi:hypothetical protein
LSTEKLDWINDQWRICFAWQDGNAFEVEIVDYHNTFAKN